MSEMSSDLESLMNEAEGRKDEILLLVAYGFTYREIRQAIEVPPSTTSEIVRKFRRESGNVVPLR
jgi:DNA-directed RNA polymerase specialized sigma24 family protein